MRLFRQLAGAIRAHYRHVEASTGIAAAEIRMLAAIAANPGAGVDVLAARLSLHKSTISNLVGKLVAKGLATRERVPEDQRSVRLRVAPAGRALLRRAPRPAEGLLQELMSGLSAHELKQVEAAFALMVARLPPGLRGYGGASLAEPPPRPSATRSPAR